jgi:hypothetical protein
VTAEERGVTRKEYLGFRADKGRSCRIGFGHDRCITRTHVFLISPLNLMYFHSRWQAPGVVSDSWHLGKLHPPPSNRLPRSATTQCLHAVQTRNQYFSKESTGLILSHSQLEEL